MSKVAISSGAAEAGRRGEGVRSDCWVKITPTKSGGIDIKLKSKVESMYGEATRALVREVLAALQIEHAAVEMEDAGALPFVIAARVEAAVRRLGVDAGEGYLPEAAPGTDYATRRERFRRSRLYLPGNEPKFMINAGIHKPDGIILDLEDSVAPPEKDAARLLVRNALRSLDFFGAERMVRINQGQRGLEDLDFIAAHNLHVVLIPKVESPDEVRAVDQRIREILSRTPRAAGFAQTPRAAGSHPARAAGFAQTPRAAGFAQTPRAAGFAQTPRAAGFSPREASGGDGSANGVYLMPIVESALGAIRAYEIASATDSVVALTIGLEDYSADIGTQRTAEGRESFWARSQVVNAARAAGVQPIDSVYSDVGDMDGLRESVLEAKSLGFEGKGCLHPRQIEVVHEAFAPSAAELEKAQRIVAAFEEAEKKGLGVVSLGSKMIDPPVVKRAQRVVRLAEAMGI